MKTILFLLVSCLVVSAQPVSQATIVDPRGTFLRPDALDTPNAPTVIDLGARGWSSGDTVLIQARGRFQTDGAGTWADRLVGIFSASSTVLGATSLHRVVDAIPVGAPAYVTAPAAPSGVQTDVFDDFLVTRRGVEVTIPFLPGGVTPFLIIGTDDTSWGNNSDPDNELRVVLSLPGRRGSLCGPFVPGSGAWTTVPNGDFEAGLAGWAGASSVLGRFVADQTAPYAGTTSARSNSSRPFSGSGFGIFRSVPVTPGETYVLSGFFRSPSGPAKATVYLDMNDLRAEASAVPVMDGGSWVFAWDTYRVPTNRTALTIRCVRDSCGFIGDEDILFDEVALTPYDQFVPPTAIGSGLCGVQPGTGDSLRISSRAANWRSRISTRLTARAGERIDLFVLDEFRVFEHAPIYLGFEAFPAGSPPFSAGLAPGYHLSLMPFLLLDSVPMPSTSVQLPILIPPGIAGIAGRFQAACFSPYANNGSFALTEAHEVVIVP